MIILTLDDKEVYISKITTARRVGVKGFLESMRKHSKIEKPSAININSDQI